MKVRVTFTYEPQGESSDPDHATGVSNEEFEGKINRLAEVFGAEDVEFERVEEEVDG